MSQLMQGPIPGQSLTDLPKNSPWEKPSELNEVSDVVRHYVDRLADDEVMDDLSVVFELGGDLKTITETLMMTGSMNGVHTVETGMLAGPIIASFIHAAMKSYGIDAPETNVDPEQRSEKREYARVIALVNKALEDEDQGSDDPGVALLQDIVAANPQEEEEEAMPVEAPLEEEEQPQGLGSRRSNGESLEGED